MEGRSNVEMKSSVSNVTKRRTTPKYSRWRPTAEQIRTLDHYYGQGLRRPTAEHIQEITAKLKCFGKAERKNVFYWFQNRNARYRKRPREEKVAASVKQMVHRCHHPNGNCGCTDGPHYVPQNDVETHPQNSKVCPPRGIEKNPRTKTVAVNAKNCSTEHPHQQRTTTEHPHQQRTITEHPHQQRTITEHPHQQRTITEHPHQQRTITEHNLIKLSPTQETLILFPLHPTVSTSQKEKMEQELNNTPTSAPMDHARSSAEVRVENDGRYAQPNFFELFSGQSYQMRD